MQRLLTCAALVLATSAAAATADLRVTLDAPLTGRAGELYVAQATIENLGPDPAPEAALDFSIWGYGREVRCFVNADLGTIHAGTRRTFECIAPIPNNGRINYTISTTASIRSAAEDVTPNDNAAGVMARIDSNGPDLAVTAYSFAGVAPALPFPFRFEVSNRSHVRATDVRVSIHSPNGFGQLPATCSADGTRATCALGNLAPTGVPGANVPLTVNLIAADGAETPFDITVEAVSSEPDNWLDDNRTVARVKTNRTLLVTTTADSGSGSLREAIEKVNALADGLDGVIAFRLGAPAGRWHTIRLQSPLPRVVRDVTIDGETQGSYFGDSNHDGPDVEIDGSALQGGNGLEIYARCRATVRGLAINGFAGAGLVVGHRTSCGLHSIVERNYLGTDPAGNHAKPNVRGLVLEADAQVRNNVISANRRAGIFASRGRSEINSNIIGVSARSDAVLPNGASGIYVGPESTSTRIQSNTIAFNGEWGIAIAREAIGVNMSGNIIHSNRSLGIDWGLDGPSPSFPLPMPEITRVTYANGETTIEGRLQPHPKLVGFTELLAVDSPDPSGFGEGQYWLGNADGDAAGRFRVTRKGDLRGKWITATATYFDPEATPFISTTTEFSPAVEVK